MKLFMLSFRLNRYCIAREKALPGKKKRAFWAILGGFSRAGVYLNS